jgi:surface antigen
MRVTSLTGRLAIAAGALGLAALTTGLTATGIAVAGVTSTGTAGPVAGSAAAAGQPAAGTASGALRAAAAIARAVIADAPAAAPARAHRPAGVLPPIPTKITLGHWPGPAGTRAAAKYYGYPYPHPPACTDGGKCVADKWAFYRGQCTSWVAYRLNQIGGIAFTNDFGGKGRWGDAVRWSRMAKKLGITVNTTPTVGSIAWYSATKPAPDGHVAYVERVNSPTSFVMSEMNYDADNGFWVHTITKTTGDWPTEFIHFAGRSPR